MTTTTNSNVINLQPGGPRATAAANRILLECRDMGVRQLRSALHGMLEAISENLLDEAEGSSEMDRRRFLNRLRELLAENGGRLEGQFGTHWTNGFDTALRGSGKAGAGKELEFADLQIVDFGDMDEELAVKAFAHRLDNNSESELYALGRRFDYLIGRHGGSAGDNPLAPQLLAHALRDAIRDAGLATEYRLELWRRLELLADARIAPIFHAINAHLVQHNVLPDLRRDYPRPAGTASAKPQPAGQPAADMFSVLQSLISGGAQATTPAQRASGLAEVLAGQGAQPTQSPQLWASLEAMQHAFPSGLSASGSADLTNVLRDFRGSEIGQGLGQVDAITVDIVAMLFDMIFDDREISDPIKALVGKLQIPVLKVALIDRSFFSSRAHPTRRLLELISRAALRWSDQIGHDDPVYRKIADVIDDLHGNFKQDTRLFASLCDELERFLKQQEANGETTASRAALLVVQRELEELADMAIAGELQLLQDGLLSAVVIDLLDHEWRAVLKHIHINEGPGSEAWSNALATASTLVASVAPKRDGQQRQGLARQLPSLLRQLSAGFDRIKLEPARRHALMDELFSVHSALLRGSQPPLQIAGTPEPYLVAAEPDLSSHSLADGNVTVKSISVTLPFLAAVAEPGVENLQRGDWVEYMQPAGAPIRYRLSWISPQRGIFLFTNPLSPNALAVSPEAMSLQLQRGEVRILSSEPIFDRALTRTIDTLQAA